MIAPLSRCPQSCEFREVSPAAAHGDTICHLATGCLGGVTTAAVRVNDAVCNACCRHPLPSGPRLNPVIASLVFAEASNREPPGSSARDVVTRNWLRQFAMRWLEAAGEQALPGEPPARSGSDPDRISKWENGQPPRIGLVGRHYRFGLGHQHRDIVVHLGIDRWLVPRFRRFADLPADDIPCRIDETDRDLSDHELADWLTGLDVVLFVESPVFPRLTEVAKSSGVRVVCIPNWEWLHPGMSWLADVDLMLCPTRHTAGLLEEWKRRFRFDWQIETVSWPIDAKRHRFQRRYFCRRFLFVNGSGGAKATLLGTPPTRYSRKGLSVLLEAARMIPEVPIIVYASPEHWEPASRNVEFRLLPADNRSLYRDGDVCVLPSLWEGLGLPMLECQAAGMPLITTDLPPMNEHNPLAVVPAAEVSAELYSGHFIPIAQIEPGDLARVMRSVYGRPLLFASRQARQFILREHNWQIARGRLLKILDDLVAGRTLPSIPAAY